MSFKGDVILDGNILQTRLKSKDQFLLITCFNIFLKENIKKYLLIFQNIIKEDRIS